MLAGSCSSGSNEGGASSDTVTSESFADLVRGFDEGADNVCTRGEVACVDAVIAEMRSRLDALVETCDHLAPWALTYLKSTEGFRAMRATPGSLDDPVFFTHLDVRFAQLYFQAFDRWHSGRKGEVPQAWQIAFEAADSKAVSGIGNLLLGISAHISRDLPVALADVGLPADGSGALADYRKVNKVFEDVMPDVITESAARFDPTVADVDIPGIAADQQSVLALIVAWRETSFIDAERVSRAGADRKAVVAQIDSVTAGESLAIRAATSYLPIISGPQARDAYCSEHGTGCSC
jgi:hypothetical protein